MKLSGLKTERQNRASADLDKLSALEIATLMNRQDAKVLRAVRNARTINPLVLAAEVCARKT